MGRGKHQASLDLIQACYDILEEIQPATVRAVCYRLFVAKIIPDMTTRSTRKVSEQLKWARENEHIDWDWIVDETRQAERISSWDDPLSFVNDVKRAYRKDMWQDQSEHIEVWSEKGTVRGTLGPVLDEYGVTFRVHHGFSSATSVHQAAEDSLDQPFIALYVGDFDPSGMHMSEIDLPDRLDRYGGEIEIVRIALLSDDTEHLPGFGVEEKRKDPRYGWFVANHGRRCWELDAMSPVDLRARVKTEICSYIDEEAWDLARKAQAAEIATINTVCNNWTKITKAISDPERK